MPSAPLSRRVLLRSLAAAGTFPAIALADTPPTATKRKPASPAEVKARLRGPILSIPTPFTADFAIDEKSIRAMCGRALEAGVPIYALTAGNGQYAWLDTSEVRDLTRMLVEAVNHKGLVIAAAGNWWTKMVVDYAVFSESIGADAVQIMLPDGCTEDAAVIHFKAVAQACGLPIILHGNYSTNLLNRLVEIPTVIALKEDVTLDYYIDRQRRFGDRLVVFGGGSEHRFLVARPYGSNCYYSAYAAFAPEESMKFWRAVQAGQMDAAFAWANRFDYPFLDRWSHAFWRASMELFGVGQRYLRPPLTSFTNEQMASAREFYAQLGLLS